ncbi:uncharacterized protein LOC120697107 isoform X1 [Panicum virgatum]|uniref:uncharacterized protein LOC120697107 isoform X1 n=1 Tax=Panicum virgatum TaxID=38727 RepID=UPI0019D64CFC|nr:uncharacterized protein LOC120697107 isoform X1 [Panicum virgatum]
MREGSQDIESKEKVQSLVQGGNEEQAEHLNTRVTGAHGGDSGSLSASSNDNKKVSREDIELVQNLIERCLQLYMNKGEVVRTLSNRARIEPGFTTLVASQAYIWTGVMVAYSDLLKKSTVLHLNFFSSATFMISQLSFMFSSVI